MRISVRALFLVAAIAFFVLVLVFEENAFELLAIGLACLAGGQLAGEMGVDSNRRGDVAA